MAGLYGNLNELYAQMNPTYSVQQGLNNMLLGGYMNFGNAMQGAMNRMSAIQDANAWRNVMNNQTEAKIAAARAPIEVEQIRQQGQGNRLSTLSPLLTQLFGSLGGSGGGGMTGFKAVDQNGTPFAQATLGGSDAKATNTSRYRRGRIT